MCSQGTPSTWLVVVDQTQGPGSLELDVFGVIIKVNPVSD